MANGIKQPRASIACSRNRDPDYLLLASEGFEGLAAVALFDALLCAAKDQDNEGRFNLPERVIAAMVGLEIKTYSNLIQRLIKIGWLISDGDGIAVRSFAKWNPRDGRGGARDGAGRPSKIGNQKNHTEIKPISKDIQNPLPPSPSPFPVPKDKSAPTACAPNFRASFLAAYPPCPNKKQGLVDAERHWFTLKPDEVERALAAVKVYAECVAKWTPQQRMRVPKPLTWLQDNGPEFAIERENWERGEERKADGSIYESEMETYNEPDKYGLAVTKRRYWRIENGKRTACFETRQAAQGL